MALSVEQFRSLIKDEVQLRWGGRVFTAEKALDLKKDTLRGLLRETAKEGPRLSTMSQVADAFGFEFYFGPPRPSPDSPLVIADHEDFIKVARSDVDISAGPGTNGDTAETASPLAFRADWMTRKGLNSTDCVVVNVRGDSMSPALLDGDLVLLDTTQRPIRKMHIYAFADTDGLVSVKRFEKTADHLIIRSDNPTYETRVLNQHDADALNVIGRVVWSGREIS